MDQMSLYMIANFVAGFMSLMAMFMLFFMFVPGIFLYFVSDKPNRVVTGIFSFKVLAVMVFMVTASVAVVFNEALKYLGLDEYETGINQDEIRISIVVFILGMMLFWWYKKFFPKSVLAKTEGKKTPGLFVSQIFHASLIWALLVMKLFIVGYVLNYLLEFVLNEYGAPVGGLEFVTNLVAIVVPTLILGFVAYPGVKKGKRFLPKLESDASAIFATFVILGSLFIFLGVLGTAVKMLLDTVLDLGPNLNLDDVRAFIMGLVTSGALLLHFVKKCGGKEAFMK